MTATITSVKDPRIGTIRSLGTVAGRRAAGRCLLEGDALIANAIDAGADLEMILAVQGESRLPAITHHVTPTVLKQALRSQKPVTALAVAALPTENAGAPYGELAVVLDGIADPGNLGTIVRTACGLGAPDVVFTDDTDYTSRRVLESSRAAVLRMTPRRFGTVTEALESLRANGFQIVVTTPRGTVTQALAPLSDAPVAVVVGNETTGVSPAAVDNADHLVRIPMSGAVESLNVGVATGLSLHELRIRMVLAGLDARCRAARFTAAGRAALTARIGAGEATRFEATATAIAAGQHVTDADRTALAVQWIDFQQATG